MSIEVLTAQFEAHKQECASDKALINSSIKELRTTVDEKVSWKYFIWIFGLLVTILISLFYYISSQLNDLSKTASVTQGDVSFLKGKLSPYDVEFKD